MSLSRTEFLGGDFDDDRGDRFDYLDADGNNRVTRQEWHASADAFTWLDRNRDGVLSRVEVEGDIRRHRRATRSAGWTPMATTGSAAPSGGGRAAASTSAMATATAC